MSISDDFVGGLPDTDPEETREWLDSLDAVASVKGRSRTEFLLQKLLERSHELQFGLPAPVRTPYINTIPAQDQRARSESLRLGAGTVSSTLVASPVVEPARAASTSSAVERSSIISPTSR